MRIDPAMVSEWLPGVRALREMSRTPRSWVFEGLQAATGRRVAIKLVSGPHALRPETDPLHEAKLAASLRHPGIVTIYDCRPWRGGCAIVMEYVEGPTLDQWARDCDARLPAPAALREKLAVMEGVCEAVQHAHQRGVIHRDLKPDNIRVEDQRQPRVLDFGAAGHAGDPAQGHTPAYAAPEQLAGDQSRVDTRADIYALGVLLSQVILGGPPGADPSLITHADLRQIVRSATDPDPDQRYATAGALREDLGHVLAGRPISRRADDVWYILQRLAARRPWSVAAVVGGVGLLAVFGVVMATLAGSLARERAGALDLLARGNLRHARLLSAGGGGAQAQALIWPELLRAGGDVTSPSLGFAGPPAQLPPAWALFEHFARFPCLATVRAAAVCDNLTIHDDGSISGALAEGGELVATLSAARYTPTIHRSPFRPAPGDRLCSAGPGRAAVLGPASLRLIDLESGRIAAAAGDRRPRALGFRASDDGSMIAVVGDDRSLRIYDKDLDRERVVAGAGVHAAARPAFSRDGRLLAAGMDDCSIAVWRTDTLELVTREPPPAVVQADLSGGESLIHVQFSPDGSLVAAGCLRFIVLWAVDGSSPPTALQEHAGFVKNICFARDAPRMLTCANDRSVRIWDTRTWVPLWASEAAEENLVGVAISHDGLVAAAVDTAGVLRVWETAARAWSSRLPGPPDTAHTVRISPDGAYTAAAMHSGTIRVWGREDQGRSISAHPKAAKALAISPDGSTLASAGAEGEVRLLDVGTGEAIGKMEGVLDRGTSLTFSPDGSVLAGSGLGNTVTIWDVATRQARGGLAGHAERVPQIAISPDGSVLASAGMDRLGLLWDLRTGTVFARLAGHQAGVRAICFSADGRLVATGSDDRTIRIWDARTGSPLRTIRGPRNDLFALVFHPEGRVLFSLCRSSTVQVWEVSTGAELSELAHDSAQLYSMDVSRDGRRLVAAGAGGSPVVWDLGYYQRHIRGNAGFWASR